MSNLLVGGLISDEEFVRDYDARLFVEGLTPDELKLLAVESVEELAIVWGPEDSEYWYDKEWKGVRSSFLDKLKTLSLFNFENGVVGIAYQDASPLLMIINAKDYQTIINQELV